MREVIIREWRDNLGIVHRDEVGELVRCGDCIYTLGSPRELVGFVYCQHCHKHMWENAYCSYGERIENVVGSK